MRPLEQAERVGSAVFRLVGNHEIAQADEPGLLFYYTDMARRNDSTPEEYEKDKGALARAKSFRNGMYAREISACAVRAVVKIGNYVFVHGGINKEVIEHANSMNSNFLDACNETLTAYMESKKSPNDFKSSGLKHSKDFTPLLYGASEIRGGIDPHPGILWDDEMSRPKEDDGETVQKVKNVINILNINLKSHTLDKKRFEPVTTFVVAHYVQRDMHGFETTKFKVSRDYKRFEDLVVADGEGTQVDHAVNFKHEGRVWCIDIGQSRAFNAMENPSIMIIQTETNEVSIRRFKEGVGSRSFIEAW